MENLGEWGINTDCGFYPSIFAESDLLFSSVVAKLVYLPSYVGGQNIWVLPSFPLLLEQLDAAAKFEDQKDVQSTLTKTLL